MNIAQYSHRMAFQVQPALVDCHVKRFFSFPGRQIRMMTMMSKRRLIYLFERHFNMLLAMDFIALVSS